MVIVTVLDQNWNSVARADSMWRATVLTAGATEALIGLFGVGSEGAQRRQPDRLGHYRG